MTLLQPAWLLLAIPIALAIFIWRPPTRPVLILRIAIVVLVLLALAGLAIELRSRAGVVVVVADRSLSMPRNADATERDVIRTIESDRDGDSRLAVVSFGRGARIELMPEGGRFGELQMAASEDGSNLHDGIERALSLIPRGTPGRIVVLGDGRWTGRDPSTAAMTASARGVAIDYRLISRPSAGDVAVERVDAPATVSPGESFVVAAWVQSPRAQDAEVTLERGGQVLAAGPQRLRAGTNRIAFRDRAPGGGTLADHVSVRAAADDPLPENNRARFLVGVHGPKPLMVVAGAETSGLARLLTAGGLAVEAPKRPDWSLEMLSNYSAVVLENVPTEDLGVNAMETMASWITESGGALMITGGKASFGGGGYFRSPLDPLLPVSMEMRREHRKLNLAIVIAMDRSGSMSMEVDGGRTKMDLANLAAVQVLDLLGPRDELGVVAVDSAAHTIAKLAPIESQPNLRSRILGIDTGGGGIFVFEALVAAASQLANAKAQTRHIILLSDAADSEEPGKYVELLEKCEKQNITVSVIGLGTPSDVDAALLKDIARRGNGRIFFTEDVRELPRLFAQDTFIVARSAFVDTPTPVDVTGALYSLTGRMFPAMPPVGGFNLCYLRDGASPAALTRDEHRAPLVASWQAGAGRVLAYTGEADGAHTGAIAQWPEVGNFYTSLARWTAGARSLLPEEMLVTQRVENGVARIDLHLDPERASTPFTELPKVTTLAGAPGGAPRVARTELAWRTPDQLAVEIDLTGAETYLSTVEVPGAGRVTLPPVCLPYSPELAPAGAEDGRAALERLARVTGGKERIAVSGVWDDLPREKRPIPLRTWLLVAAVVLLLAEVLERRMRLLSSVPLPAVSLPRLARTPRAPKPAYASVEERHVESVPEPPAAPPSQPELLEALRKAGSRARRKM